MPCMPRDTRLKASGCRSSSAIEQHVLAPTRLLGVAAVQHQWVKYFEARLQIPETLPDEVLAKMHGAPKPDLPTVTTAHLQEADGFLLGFPTRWVLGSRPGFASSEG